MRLVFCIAVAFFSAAPVFALEPTTVRLELTDRSKIEGVWDAESLSFASEYGLWQLDLRKIKTLEFGAAGTDTVQIEGLEHRFRGTVKLEKLRVGGRDYERDQVRSLKQIHGGPTNVVSDIVIPLITLAAMEIVLGIDNIIFLAIVAGKLPRPQQPKARRLGLIAALGTRLLLLATLSFILGLTAPVFTLPQMPVLHDMEAREVSWRDIILLVGGLFLIGKSTYEIHAKLEKPGGEEPATRAGSTARFGLVLLEIAVIDIIFSLDSVITAVGMAESLAVMVTAMIIAVGVMMLFAEKVSRFVARHPTIKVLALAFLILIGVLLVAEGLGQHIDKGYVYFAMAFAVIVETVNLRLRKRAEALRLNQAELPAGIS